MPIIHKLAPEISSRIAAGEVAERPFNVVKELMENSLDAGATKVTVEISDGGLSFVRITDNGRGIAYDDLPLALERFATSKTNCVEDVYSVATFGFRGEALAAISAVSDFTLRSGKQGGKSFEIKSHFGSIGEIKPAPALCGTMAEAIDLFKNVPARRKFLKTSRSLESEITRFVKYFSLINPEVEIDLYCNGKCLYSVNKSENVCARASKVFPEKCFFKGEQEINSAKAIIATLLPAACDRLKRDGIVIGVNGRLIKDASITQAVVKAYFRLIPIGRFPLTVVNLQVNPNEVDVNVHPAKMEVRFAKSGEIFTLVTNAIAKTLESSGMSICYSNDATAEITSMPLVKAEYPAPEQHEASLLMDSSPGVINAMPKAPQSAKKSGVYTVNMNEIAASCDTPFFDYKTSAIDRTLVKNEKNASLESKKRVPEYKIIGAIKNTYIVCETADDNILFIDQHAAHERILFEKHKLINKTEKPSIALYSPVPVKLTSEEKMSALQNILTLESYGYDIQENKNGNIEITRVPQTIIRQDIPEIFKKVVSELCTDGASRTDDAPLALLSCKSAIKAGDKLTELEMKYLVDLLFRTSNFTTCPHGRPILYKMGINELARKFLR